MTSPGAPGPVMARTSFTVSGSSVSRPKTSPTFSTRLVFRPRIFSVGSPAATSNIFGTLQTTNFGTANLYLINPAGVILGPTAQLNVAGSVHVSTADYLRLSDNVRFNAMPGPSDALLSAAPVAAFGFLGPTVAPISVQGGPGTPPLAVPQGQ